MKYHLEWPTVLQALERNFLTEIEDSEKQFYPDHAPTPFERGTEDNRSQSENHYCKIAQLVDEKL
jgi:hypothetical protein